SGCGTYDPPKITEAQVINDLNNPRLLMCKPQVGGSIPLASSSLRGKRRLPAIAFAKAGKTVPALHFRQLLSGRSFQLHVGLTLGVCRVQTVFFKHLVEISSITAGKLSGTRDIAPRQL